MRRVLFLILPALFAVLADGRAGPYSPDGGRTGSSALSATNAGFVGWASDWVEYLEGEDNSPIYTDPQQALGPAGTSIYQPGNTNAFATVSLGNGGSLTVTFAEPVRDADGFDFAVFENGFPLFLFVTNSFLELAYVEASADGTNFVRFPSTSLTPGPVGGYTAIDPTGVDGLAGTASVGWGTPFDLATIGLDHVVQIRVVDIVGTGTNGCFDSDGRPIYDPSPVYGSAGFDLDAIGVFRTHDYATWCRSKFSTADAQNPALSGPGADPDQDGLPNLAEYALRLPPLSGNRDEGPHVVRDVSGPAFVFTRHPDKRDITCDVEFSADLITWTPVARSTNGTPFVTLEPEPGVVVTETGDDVACTVVVRTTAAHSQAFFRLNTHLP